MRILCVSRKFARVCGKVQRLGQFRIIFPAGVGNFVICEALIKQKENINMNIRKR